LGPRGAVEAEGGKTVSSGLTTTPVFTCIQKTSTPPKRSQKASMSFVVMSLRWRSPPSAREVWSSVTWLCRDVTSAVRASTSDMVYYRECVL